MAKIGYARVSTKDQNLDLQLAELEKSWLREGVFRVQKRHKSPFRASRSD